MVDSKPRRKMLMLSQKLEMILRKSRTATKTSSLKSRSDQLTWVTLLHKFPALLGRMFLGLCFDAVLKTCEKYDILARPMEVQQKG